MEARQRRRAENARLLERLRHRICPHFNQGQDKDVCQRPPSKRCQLDLQHICASCACPGHGSHRCRNDIRDDSSPNPDNVVIRHVDPRDPLYSQTKAEVFVTSPADHTAQAAIRRDHRNQGGNAGRVFHVLWDHSEQMSARYKQYRQKSRDTKQKDKKDIWPDDIEEAFQIGLRCYARRGRKKEELHGKQCGGNEFISDWIWAATSVWRDRKQVSSHIQVLKGYMMHNQRWLDLLKGDPRWKKLAQGEPQPPASPLESQPLHTTLTPLMPQIPSKTHSPAMDGPPSGIASGPTIRTVKFDMTRCFVQPANHAQPPRIHHRYTSIQSEMGSAPRPLDGVAQWRQKFPHFSVLDNYGQPTPIFLFESSLDLIEDDPKEKTSISVTFEVDFAQAACYRDWIQRTHVSDMTGHTDFLEKELSPAASLDNSDQSLTLPLHFRASYWAQTISVLLGRYQAARQAGLADQRNHDEHSRRFVNSISLMQELWATPATSPASQPQRMAVLLWKFQQTHGSETPTTSWRRLNAPNAPPVAELVPYSAPTMNESYESQYLADSGRAGSPGSVPTLVEDDRSFPSATSASFPAHISGPVYQPPMAPYNVYGGLGSFPAPSEYQYGTQDYQQPKMVYGPRDSYQGSEYPQYEYGQPAPSTETQPDAHFYDPIRMQQPNNRKEPEPATEGSFSAPLIAPRAHLISQHQILQLEQLGPYVNNSTMDDRNHEQIKNREVSSAAPAAPMYAEVPNQWPLSGWQTGASPYNNSTYHEAGRDQGGDGWYGRKPEAGGARTEGQGPGYLDSSASRPVESRFRPLSSYPPAEMRRLSDAPGSALGSGPASVAPSVAASPRIPEIV